MTTTDHGQLVPVSIDGQTVHTHERDHTGQQLRELITPAAAELWLDVPDAQDAYVASNATLAITAHMRFFTSKQVQVFVNGTPHLVPAGTITEQQLRELPTPAIPDEHRIWRDVVDELDDPVSDEELLIVKDGDRFFSKPLTLKITVNGRPRTVGTRALTFEDIVDLAFPGDAAHPDKIYTVTYSRAIAPHATGSLRAGETVTIKNGTIFSVTATIKS